MSSLKCPIEWCGYVAPTIAALELHLRVEHGVTNVVCTCGAETL